MKAPGFGHHVDRLAIGAAALWCVVCVVWIGWHAVRSPMSARETALQTRLAAVTYEPEALIGQDSAPLGIDRRKIVEKEALWRPLVAAPPPPPAPEAIPDLLEKLKGVTVSRRDQIRAADGLKIKARLSPDDKRGRWIAVGDTVNGLKVAEITPETVVFTMEQNGKQYSTQLPRR